MNLQVRCLHLLTLETSQHSQKQWMEAMWRPADWKGEQSNRKEKDKRSKWVLDRHCCCYLFIQHTTHNTHNNNSLSLMSCGTEPSRPRRAHQSNCWVSLHLFISQWRENYAHEYVNKSFLINPTHTLCSPLCNIALVLVLSCWIMGFIL